MLDAYIIEQIRKREEERRRMDYEAKCTAAGEDIEPFFDLWSGFNVFKYWEGKRVIWRRLGMTVKLRDRVYEVSGTDAVKIAIMGAEIIGSSTND